MNFFRRLMSYFGMASNLKFDEMADPKIQIEQAIQEAQKRHSELKQQASTVIGNERQLEMKLARQETELEQIKASATQALIMAEEARAKGDEERFLQLEQSASAFATQLVANESSTEDLRTLLAGARTASQQARDAVSHNTFELEKKLAERTKLLTQLEQAKMQETINKAMEDMSALAPRSNVDSLEKVRDKIEARHANAMGTADLQSNSTEGRMMEVRRAAMDAGAATRLDQLRAGLGIAVPNAAPAAEAPSTEAVSTTKDAAGPQAN